MTDKFIYHEKIVSNRTSALFLALTLLFLALLAWRVAARGLDTLAVVFLCFAAIFLFYTLNYRALILRLTPASLCLTFGIFTWRVPLENVAECHLDQLPRLMYLGGAGIHFMTIRSRYRASFNFLEYPRVVVALKRKAGLVRDLSFSTRQPEQVLRLLQETLTSRLIAPL